MTSFQQLIGSYTTSVELFEPESTAISSDASETDSADRDTGEADIDWPDGMTSAPHSSHSSSTGEMNGSGFNIDLDDLDAKEHSGAQSSFPSIRFGGVLVLKIRRR